MGNELSIVSSECFKRAECCSLKIDSEKGLTIQSYAGTYQDYPAVSRSWSSSSPEHSGSTRAPFQHPARLWQIIDSIYHRDWEVLVLLEKHLKKKKKRRRK